MNASALLAQFRALGGIAENVSIRPGLQGHGVFAVNPIQPVRLVTPAQLLISPGSLWITPEGQVKVKPASGLRAEVVAFHEDYQRGFAWGAGGFEYIRAHRAQMRALPDAVKKFLPILGCPDDLNQPLVPLEAFKRYCISRQISVKRASQLMPVLELVNHANAGAPYVVTPAGVSLSGRFADEVQACYRQRMDAFHFFFNYHFATPGRSILSCNVSVNVPGFKTLRISRLDGLSQVRGGVHAPQVSDSPDEIQLSFTELANLDAPALPRQVFLELMSAQGLPTSRAHQLFDGLLGHHRRVLEHFLKACPSAEGQVLRDLKKVAGDQWASLNPTGLCQTARCS